MREERLAKGSELFFAANEDARSPAARGRLAYARRDRGFGECGEDPLDDVDPCLVGVVPASDRPAVPGKRLKLRQRAELPDARAHEDRHDARAARRAPIERALDLLILKLVGREKMRAQKEQDHVRRIELCLERRSPIGAWGQHLIVPDDDSALSA
ncbi:MAG TPA: hypothetical protein VE093_03625 [Polyangiaceae bacterium]|nr:hypothetical protein [Polyangiaceae bacterium]